MHHWVTNDPEVARHLNAADHAFAEVKARASNLPLADKIVALREARAARIAAYRAAIRGDN